MLAAARLSFLRRAAPSPARLFSTTNTMSAAKKIVVTRELMPEAMDLLRKKEGVEVVTWPEDRSAPRDWLLENAKGASGLLVMLSDKVDEALLEAAGPDLKVVSTLSVGYDHCELAAFKKRGVKLGYTPELLTDATADISAMLYLMATRRAGEAVRFVERGEWPSVGWGPLLYAGYEPKGKKIGFFGFGRIAQATANRLIGFGVSSITYIDSGRHDRSERDAGLSQKWGVPVARAASLDALASESDAVILLAGLTPETKHVVSSDFLGKMKRTAVLVNVGRGGLVDNDALAKALKEGQIAGAGLDVIEGEPSIGADHPLVKEDRCVVLPHIGSATVETRTAMALLSARNAIGPLFGGEVEAEYKF